MLEPYWNSDYIYHQSHRHQFDYLGHAEISQHLAFIHEGLLSLNHGSIAHDVELIHRCREQTKRLPVLTLDNNPHDVKNYVRSLRQHLEPTDFFVFNSDIRPEMSPEINVAPWPGLLYNQQFNKNFQLNRPKKYRISYLSGTLRYHRLKLFREIKPWIKNNDIVVINRFGNDQNFYNTAADSAIDFDEWTRDLPWQSQLGLIDTDQTEQHANQQHSNHHLAYAACVNITGETASSFENQVFITEKTWKAYMSGCLVINFGLKDTPNTLLNFGIEIWSEYDRCEHVGDKIRRITELFQRDDIFEMYHQKREMVRYNQNLVCSLGFAKELAEPAVKKLECMIQSR